MSLPPISTRRAALILGIVSAAAWGLVTRAQEPARGQDIAPVYEGFRRNADGSFDLLFGYYNRNWEEEIDVAIGRDNSLEPGGPDQGQPAHFFPRRNQFVFSVRVPADFGNREIVWSLKSNGVTNTAYGTLRPAYAVDDGVMSANCGASGVTGYRPDIVGNRAPELAVQGQTTLIAKVGVPITLTAVATDDGRPTRRPMPVALAGQSHTLPNSATGLRVSWFLYRGPGPVVFDPPQTKVWQDVRDGGNSPWSAGWEPPPIPPDNQWIVQATFSEAGTYVLRALAHDGGLVDYDDVTITVTR